MQTLSAQILLVRIKYSANDADCVTYVIIRDVHVHVSSCPAIVMYFYEDVIGILKNNTYSYFQILRLLEFEPVSVGNRISTFLSKLVFST